MFSIWKMEKLPGVGFLHIISDDEIGRMIGNTVNDMATFFAAAWRHPQDPPAEARLAFSKQCSAQLDLLSKGLPESLRGYAYEAACKLPDITSTLPWVLTHGDLSSMNILVDSSSGHLMGVIDWAEADIQPFGLALWGLEDILEYCNAGGWNWLSEDQGAESRRMFSDRFVKETQPICPEVIGTIENARKLGLLLRYGFECDGPSETVTTDETFLGRLLKRKALHDDD